MTAPAQPLLKGAGPMPAERRFGIATASSVAFHLLVVILIGLLTGRPPAPTSVLIPIELTVTEGASGSLELGGGGQPEAETTDPESTATQAEPEPPKPSSAGGRAKAAPAPPKVLTSEKGEEPAGPVNVGEDEQGEGGEEEAPKGPTRGPGVVGGPSPIYPKDALDQGLEGRVTVSVSVGGDGSISSISIEESTGHNVLDQAAVRAVRNGWVFEPGLKDGDPAAGKATVTFEFRQGKAHPLSRSSDVP
jgi:protein TonB